ncbi:MAG: hypothetical protein ACXADH_15750, partial [Candidatus Kariarchaeaceae archaeon]
MKKTEWSTTKRLEVPGGWLYLVDHVYTEMSSAVFVPQDSRLLLDVYGVDGILDRIKKLEDAIFQ